MKSALTRILSIIICLSMLVTMLLVPVSAARKSKSGYNKNERFTPEIPCSSVDGEHSFNEDNICTICGYDISKVFTIHMYDSYGDG